MLKVNHDRLGAGPPYLVRLIGVTDQPDRLIAAPGQDPGEAQSNLTVASGDGYSHGFTLTERTDLLIQRRLFLASAPFARVCALNSCRKDEKVPRMRLAAAPSETWPTPW